MFLFGCLSVGTFDSRPGLSFFESRSGLDFKSPTYPGTHTGKQNKLSGPTGRVAEFSRVRRETVGDGVNSGDDCDIESDPYASTREILFSTNRWNDEDDCDTGGGACNGNDDGDGEEEEEEEDKYSVFATPLPPLQHLPLLPLLPPLPPLPPLEPTVITGRVSGSAHRTPP
jgi:hypothetical protein